jgi:hypothetical protein
VQFWKFLVGFCAFLEVPRRIVHIWEILMRWCTSWKFIMGFCALFEVNHGILCIFGRSSSDRCNQSVCMLQKHVFCREKVKGWNGHVYALPWGNSKNE